MNIVGLWSSELSTRAQLSPHKSPNIWRVFSSQNHKVDGTTKMFEKMLPPFLRVFHVFLDKRTGAISALELLSAKRPPPVTDGDGITHPVSDADAPLLPWSPPGSYRKQIPISPY